VTAGGDRSGVNAAVLLLTVPSVPQLAQVVPEPGGAALSWQPPTEDAAAPVDRYEVVDGAGAVVATAGGQARGADVGGLTTGRAYALSVRAANRKSVGPATAPIEVVPQAGGLRPGSTPGGTPGASGSGAGFAPLPPARVLDTRDGTGGHSGRLAPGRPLTLRVAGRGGVPATGATSVVLNTTVTGPAASGYLTVYPGASPPLASNLNYVRGQTVANLVTVPVGPDGAVHLVASAGSPHAIADVVGWYGPAAGASFGPLPPARVLDTRDGTGLAGRLSPGHVVQLALAGREGVPARGASAVALNLTATGASASGHLTAFPCGPVPGTSNVNYPAGATVPNLAIVPLAPDGSICLQSSAGSPHVVADVVGWYGAGASTGFTGLSPARVIDTRNGTGTAADRLLPGASRTVPLLGHGFLPTSGVRAVVMNVTVTGPSAPGYLTVHPGGTAPPVASNLNYVRSQTVPNLVVVPVGPDGTVSFTSSAGSPHLVADVVGWYG